MFCDLSEPISGYSILSSGRRLRSRANDKARTANLVDERLPQLLQHDIAVDVACGSFRHLGVGRGEVLGAKLDGGTGKTSVVSRRHCREEAEHSADRVTRCGSPVEPETSFIRVVAKFRVCGKRPAGHTQERLRHFACESPRRVGGVVLKTVADHENGVAHPHRLATIFLATAEGDHGFPGEVPESTLVRGSLAAIGVEDAVAEDEGIGIVQTTIALPRDPVRTPEVMGTLTARRRREPSDACRFRFPFTPCPQGVRMAVSVAVGPRAANSRNFLRCGLSLQFRLRLFQPMWSP